MTQVAVKKADAYNPLELSQVLSEALSEAGLALPQGARVLLKPNVVAQNYPNQCTTTHPAVIEALCMLLSDKGCRITMGDSSAYYQGGYTRRGFRTSGIETIARRYAAELVPFEEDGGVLMHHEPGAILKDILVSRRLLETDCLISAAKLKTHAFAGMTGTVKNLYGLIPGGTKYEYHFVGEDTQEQFGEKIADLYGLVKPEVFVLDAVRGLEGLGPASTGKPKPTGILMVSANGYALDYLAARMIGIDPEKNEIIQAGIQRGFLKDPGKIELRGDFNTLPSIPYKLPEKSSPHPKEESGLYKFVSVYPEIRNSRCTGCGLCVKGCPTGAMKGSGIPSRNPAICLRCLYCFYLCPAKAVVLKGENPLLNRVGRIIRRIIRL